DNHGFSVVETATVDVTVTDTGPTVAALSGATNEDTASTLTVSAHGEDAGDSITAYQVAATSSSGATLTNDGGGGFTYNPNGVAAFETLQLGQTATDTFLYTVTDNHGFSVVETATVDVTVTDTGPTVAALSGATNEDTASTLTVSAHGEDAGDSITAYQVAATSSSGATLTNDGGGVFTYNPNGGAAFETLQLGQTATDTFLYTVTDNHGFSVVETATVDVTVTDTGPTVAALSGATNEDTASTLTVSAHGEDAGDSITAYQVAA